MPELIDEAARRRIRTELGRCMLVEAAAGTGKTTSIVERMIALLGSGVCRRVGQLAAVTFTRKAAAELRARFRVAVEREVSRKNADSTASDHLRRALGELEQGFIGTIHAFCAQLLRERPFEAGVDPAFSELDEGADRRVRQQAWEMTLSESLARGGSELRQLQRINLRPDQLRDAFERFADYPDVEEWPLPAAQQTPFDLARLWSALDTYTERMRRLFPRGQALPSGSDGLIEAYRRLPRVAAHYEVRDDHCAAAELLGFFEGRNKSLVLRCWQHAGFSAEEAKTELDRWQQFHDEVVEPALSAWREGCYRPVMRLFDRARLTYDRLRAERGLLNYQDLLLRAARLLRSHQTVRRYFARRTSHLLVDEFQDTDPIQAEVMMWLTADGGCDQQDAESWRSCRPRPGALFVVGDPKQSIYRFRRADIITYNQVKAIIGDSGGLVEQLSTNFRSRASVVDWINRRFAPEFPAAATDASPPYVPLVAGRGVSSAGAAGALEGVWALRVPREHSATKEAVIVYEADRIARTIRAAIDSQQTIARTSRATARGKSPQIGPGDFMIIARKRGDLSTYARALQRYGVACQVSGGCALRELPGLLLLHRCLVAAIQPDNPVALVAALRSELFGVSDVALYAHRKAGGRFNYFDRAPAQAQEAVEAAFAHLRRHNRWLSTLPLMAAVERIAGDLGLMVFSAAHAGGAVEAGSFGKALELLRDADRTCDTAQQLVDYLGRVVTGEEAHDGIGATEETDAVRVMNLHKAKGLEAEVVFLANPTGEPPQGHPVMLHVDRAGDQVQGFMGIYQQRGRVAPLLLAQPGRWLALAAEEERFLQAEELRLRYVAATRAGSRLVISERATHAAASPWKLSLEGIPELPDPGELPVAHKDLSAESSELCARQWAGFGASLEGRVARVQQPTYDELRSAEEAEEEDDDWRDDEQGAVGEELSIPPELAARAARSARCHRALPFSQHVDRSLGLPTIVRGELALAFAGSDGWVLVVRRGRGAAARESQRAQVAMIAWQQATGEAVSEVFLLDDRELQPVALENQE